MKKGRLKVQVRQKSEKWLIKMEELIKLKNTQTICIQQLMLHLAKEIVIIIKI